MNKLAEKLRKNGYDLKYDCKNSVIEIPDGNIIVYEKENMYCVRMHIDGQNFERNIKSCYDVYDFLADMLSGEITFTRVSGTALRIDNWNPYKREIKFRKICRLISRILNIAVGAGLTLWWAVFLIMGLLYYIDYTSLNWLEDSTPVPIAVAGIVIGVSMVHHGLTKNPISFGGTVLYGVGVNLTSCGMSLLMWLVSDYSITPKADFFGTVGVFVMFMALGVFMLIAGLRSDKREELNVKPASQIIFRIPELPPEKDLQRLVDAVIKKSEKEAVLINVNPEKVPSLFDSKFGGLPYWDLSRPYPVDSDGNEMQLLAQFNLSEIPENDKLPKEGMLQFFISAEETKVVYHKSIDYMMTENDIVQGDEFFLDECGISFQKIMMPMSSYDYSACDLLHETAKELGIPLDKTIRFDELYDESEYFDLCAGSLLGNAYFINYDIRSENSRYNTLLFQMQSIDDENIYIMWGDCGLCQFFINDKDLSELNFDDVFFGYDCY